MALIKIKEGSCEVWHSGKPGEKTTDHGHGKGDRVKIHFVDWGTRYHFVDGECLCDDKEVGIFDGETEA